MQALSVVSSLTAPSSPRLHRLKVPPNGAVRSVKTPISTRLSAYQRLLGALHPPPSRC